MAPLTTCCDRCSQKEEEEEADQPNSTEFQCLLDLLEGLFVPRSGIFEGNASRLCPSCSSILSLRISCLGASLLSGFKHISSKTHADERQIEDTEACFDIVGIIPLTIASYWGGDEGATTLSVSTTCIRIAGRQ